MKPKSSGYLKSVYDLLRPLRFFVVEPFELRSSSFSSALYSLFTAREARDGVAAGRALLSGLSFSSCILSLLCAETFFFLANGSPSKPLSTQWSRLSFADLHKRSSINW